MDPTPPVDEQAINRRPGKGGIVPPVEHRFRPGVSGNPGGRPSGRSVTARLREILDTPARDGKQVADVLAEVIVKHALKGDYRFVAELLNRTEGKVADRLAGPDGGPLEHTVTHRVRIVEVVKPDGVDDADRDEPDPAPNAGPA